MDSVMSTVRVLWVDLCCQPAGQGLDPLVSAEYAITKVACIEDARDGVRSAHPDLMCVEFDYPDEPHLQIVPAIKREFPDLPLLMFTEYHSEALAVRAFRWGVWDYRVKPVSASILARSIGFAASVAGRHNGSRILDSSMPADLTAPGRHITGPVVTTARTASVVAYVAGHYMEPISRSDMAALCHLSLSEFSRVFRREHEVTFEHFLLEFRIAKARDLLIESRLTITQVAHAVGFNDSSYFARAFRRCTGIKASDWRRGAIVNPPAGAR
jgi:AraC-like DNA-binding protein/CheY-like chemotaxis protein